MDNLLKDQMRKVIVGAVKECRQSYSTNLQELREVLISVAGELAVGESHLTQRALDFACGCRLDSDLKIVTWSGCRVHGDNPQSQ